MKFLATFCNNDNPSRAMYGLVNVDYENNSMNNVTFEGFALEAIDQLFGCTGIAVWDDEIYLGLQSPDSSIAVLGRDLQLKRVLRNRNIVDAHGLLIRDGQAYIVSTGTNCILRSDLQTLAKVELVYGEGAPVDTDHINDLCLRDGALVACKFGPRRRSGGRTGSVFDVATGRPLFDNIVQPHSVTCFENELYVVESATGNVLHLTESLGPKPILTLGGYGRGLAITEDVILVGRSDRRTVSRHGGPAGPQHLSRNEGPDGGSAGIFVYDRANRHSLFIDLSSLCSEIYQILRIE